MGKPYKHHKSAGERFVQIPEWLQKSQAWDTMKPGPRALYLELKRRYNSVNNGRIFLSQRDAAKALNVGRDTVAGYFSDLKERGFIVVTKGHHLGPNGIGQAAHYALTEVPLDSKPASKDFMAWKKQNPGRKTRHLMAGKPDTSCRKMPRLKRQKSENPAALEQKTLSDVSENPAIYTSSQIPQENAWAGALQTASTNILQGRGLCGLAGGH